MVKGQDTLFQKEQLQTDDGRIFLTGECHSKKDYHHTHELFQYLYATHHTHRIILELPQEYEYAFNKYLNDPAPKNKNTIELFYSLQTYKPEDLYTFLEQLRVFNLSIKDSSEKISIVCPDVSPVISYALFRIGIIQQQGSTDNRVVRKYIRKAGRIRSRHFYNNQNEKTVSVVYGLKECLDKYEDDLKDVYKNDFFAVKRKITCLYNATIEYQKHQSLPDSVREQMIYENILDIYHQDPAACFFGSYGLLHTLTRCDLKQVTGGKAQVEYSMAERLNRTPGLEGKVTTLVYYYDGNDELSDKCNFKFSEKQILTLEEQEQYKARMNDRQYLYIPVHKLRQAALFENMFKYLIISK